MYTFSKEFGDGYRSLTNHLRKMETTIKEIFTCEMCQKQRWESDISRKIQIIHTFCWSKPIKGASDTNLLDRRCSFNVDTTSYRRNNDVVYQLGTG